MMGDRTIVFPGRSLSLSRTLVLGVLNVTPDSFSDGGRFFDTDTAVEHAKDMVLDGADMIDVGAESSRPGAEEIGEAEELKRLKPVVERLVAEVKVPVSVDTYKPNVASACLDLGAHMVNDITGLRDDRMIGVVAEYQVPVVLMHMRGTPQNMQDNPTYFDVVDDIMDYFRNRLESAKDAGVENIILDPGIGFGKSLQHNLEIIRQLTAFTVLGHPLMVGPSRKSFIGQLTDLPVGDRVEGTLAAVTACVLNDADIVRVHDVGECVRAVRVADAIKHS
jgi:dihydropteroate synthase